MSVDAKAIDEALATVQRALDQLTARGHHEAAFDIARAQFAASVRASWPSNLSAVSAAVEHALTEAGLTLTDAEREQLRQAAAVLRSVVQP